MSRTIRSLNTAILSAMTPTARIIQIFAVLAGALWLTPATRSETYAASGDYTLAANPAPEDVSVMTPSASPAALSPAPEATNPAPEATNPAPEATNPAPTPWKARSGADLVEIVECTAFQEAQLSRRARLLERDLTYTLAHRQLSFDTRVHIKAVAVRDAVMDHATRKAVMQSAFPDGLWADDLPGEAAAAARIDRWTRCLRLYARIRDAAGM